MADNPRMTWLVAFDSNSPRLQGDDFKQLSVKECKITLIDATKILVQLRLEKRVRSNQVVEELRRLQDDGRIQSAWIEKRPSANDDGIMDSMVQMDGTLLLLERIHKSTPKSKHKSQSPIPDDGGEDHDEIQSLIAACMQDIQKRMRQLEQQLRSRKRTRLPPPLHAKPPYVEYNRPPVKLSFLRTATVSELYYSGVWVPEFDVDPHFDRRPKRECRFRSELAEDQYVDGYDIDDATYRMHPDVTLCRDKEEALKRSSYMRFVDKRPTRSAVSLHTLRQSPLNVLCCLRVFLLAYDIDDETRLPEPVPDRPRMTRSELAERNKLPAHWSTEGFGLAGLAFIQDYDIDDVQAEEMGQTIKGSVMAWKQDIQNERAGQK
jgi:hypothetical protein